MNTFKIDDLEIDNSDYKLFKKWAKVQPELFNNCNFLTGFLNLELEVLLPKYYLEFFYYNKYYLNNKYAFSKMNLFIKSSSSLEKFILNTMEANSNLPLSNFKIFYQETLSYLKKSKQKDWEKEYQLLTPYWSFLNDMEHSKIYNFNRFIIYLNKNIFTKQKGIKYGR